MKKTILTLGILIAGTSLSFSQNTPWTTSSGTIGNIGIGTTAVSTAKLNIGGSQYTSHFYHGINENTYIRPGMALGSVIMDKGNVGIGTASPSAKLEVNGNIKIGYNDDVILKDINHGLGWYGAAKLFAGNYIDGPVLYGYLGGALGVRQGGVDVNVLNWHANGNVGIGTTKTNDDFKLSVGGKMRAEEIEVSLASSGWADYVFADDYQLNTLQEVEEYIEENNHLPNVPSAEDVEENGVNLAEMDAILLRKIEELTLYVIELEKKIQVMK